MWVKNRTFLCDQAGVRISDIEHIIDTYYIWAFWTRQRQSLPMSASTISGFRALRPPTFLLLCSWPVQQDSLRVSVLKKYPLQHWDMQSSPCMQNSMPSDGSTKTPLIPQSVQPSVNTKHPFSFLNPGAYYVRNHGHTKHIAKAIY